MAAAQASDEAPREAVRMVPISQIRIPQLRVSAQYDPELVEELIESIARQGILQPLQVDDVDGTLWLVDGLNRIKACQALGIHEVPCLIREGTTEGVLLKNLITARQKGKSNPAEEAKVIRSLREEGGLPLEKVAEVTGLSVAWARKLNDISYLPGSVLTLVGEGKLGVTHAMELLRLKDLDHQREVADQAVQWRYTVEQIRFRVQALLQPQAVPEPGGVQFDPRGAPSRVPIPCYVCKVDLTGTSSYLWICPECQALINEFLRAYFAPQEVSQAPVSASPPDDGSQAPPAAA